MSSTSPRLGTTPTLRYRRDVRPLHFPESEPEELRVPEGKAHVMLKTALWMILRAALRPSNSIGCDQFVYWLANNNRRACAPDVFVKLGVPDFVFGSWKTWEHGTPELAVEIVRPFDGKRLTWHERFERYYEMGIRELVRFDPEKPPGERLRVFDRVEGDLVERVVESDTSPCVTLGLTWVVAPLDGLEVGLRLADANGALLLTEAEGALRRVEELETRLAALGPTR